MRPLLVALVVLALVTAAPAVSAAPPDTDDLVDPRCFDQTAQPSEHPFDLVFAVAGAAVCVLKS